MHFTQERNNRRIEDRKERRVDRTEVTNKIINYSFYDEIININRVNIIIREEANAFSIYIYIYIT